MEYLERGRFRGQRMALGSDRDQALFWVPDDLGHGEGFCFDLPAEELDDLIELLTALKGARAVPVETHHIEENEADDDRQLGS